MPTGMTGQILLYTFIKREGASDAISDHGL